jgi:glycosyltransferase involved in cell wall biosynthesis
MTTFKINILYEFQEGPWGGGNQFLKALREYLRKAGVYAENPDTARVVLFNSHQCLDKILGLRRKHADKIFLHRVDGPVSFVRGRDRGVDKAIIRHNNLCTDGTIFQSQWSQEKNYELGMKPQPYETIITNAADPSIFYPKGEDTPSGRKIRLIATSWSENMRRGFDIYQYLDDYLDFDKYEMTFVGNSPIEFKNIKSLKPAPSHELAAILREHDIYITASRNDPCSNSLIEALSCGLPAVARHDGGHPEVVGQAGAFFKGKGNVIEAIDKVAQNYSEYRARIDRPSLDEIGGRYYQFAGAVYSDYRSGKYVPKQVGLSHVVAGRLKTAPSGILRKIRAIIK